MIQENQDQELELDQTEQVEETTEENQETSEVEKPELTLEQQRAIHQREITKIDKKLGKSPEVKPKDDSPVVAPNISLKDLRALQNVPDEKVEEVMDFAKLKKLPIPEAVKHPVIQSLLRIYEEEQKTAAATATQTTRRTNSRTSAESLLAKARSGELKEDEMADAAKARLEQKRKGT